MAFIILIAIPIGIYADSLPRGKSPRVELLDIHKSLGMTALLLVLLRIVWRVLAGEPPYRRAPDRLNNLAVKGAHLLLYAVMLHAADRLFVLGRRRLFAAMVRPVQLARLLPRDKAQSNFGDWLHYYGAWRICGLLLLHWAAVIHRFVMKDEVLSRMWPHLK
jgi:cytochrome b561